VAQISEFSLIFMAMGVSIGHVGEDSMGLVTLVGLVTIALSVYMITFSHQIYARLEPCWAGPKGPIRSAKRRMKGQESADYDYMSFSGLGRYGCRIGKRPSQKGHNVLGVDFDPEALSRVAQYGYGRAFWRCDRS
jgi:hypothetical protein